MRGHCFQGAEKYSDLSGACMEDIRVVVTPCVEDSHMRVDLVVVPFALYLKLSFPGSGFEARHSLHGKHACKGSNTMDRCVCPQT